MPAYDVAVVGLGAMGAATLHDLARRGRRTIGLERFEPGHDRGSSHGESRLIRLAYFEDPAYVPLVRLAYRNWRALEAATGARLLTVTGMLEAGRAGSPIVQGSLRSAREHDLAHERLTAAQIAARFPAFALPADWEGLFQPDGGVLQPEAAVRLYVRTAQALGAVVRTNTRVLGVAPMAAGGVRLDLGGGETIEAGSVVVAAGPWIGELAPTLAPHLRLTRQVLAWFRPLEPALAAPERFPGFPARGPGRRHLRLSRLPGHGGQGGFAQRQRRAGGGRRCARAGRRSRHRPHPAPAAALHPRRRRAGDPHRHLRLYAHGP